MADSNYTINRLELVKKALRRVGNTTPTQAEIADATSELNLLIKRIDVDGNWLWATSNTPISLNTVSSTKSYAVGTAPVGIPSGLLGIEKIWYVNGNSRTYLEILEKGEFRNSVFQETGTGVPAQAYFERKPISNAGVDQSLLWILPSPAGVYALEYYARRRIYDFDNASDNPDFPQEWFHCLRLQLANLLAPEYDVKLDERQLLTLEAEVELKKMLGANAEVNQDSEVKPNYF